MDEQQPAIAVQHKETPRINKIRNLSFMMACMIVWLHSTPEGNVALLLKTTRITNSFCSCAVPFFFFISGFLFFLHYHPNGIQNKLVTRFRTLFVPYILWNIIASFCWFLIACVANHEYVEEISRYHSFSEYLYLFLFSGHLSIFWFIRNLIVYQVLSPFFYYFLLNKQCGVLIVVITLVASLIMPMSYTSLLYWIPIYLAGCLVAIHRKEWIINSSLSNTCKVLIILLWLFCFITSIITGKNQLLTLFRFLSPIGFVIIYDYFSFTKHFKSCRYLNYSFGIYAMHWIPLYVVQTYHSRHTISQFDDYIVFYLLPIILILISLFICSYLESNTPKLYALLMGGRASSNTQCKYI